MKDTKRVRIVSPKTYAQVKKVLMGMATEVYSNGLKANGKTEAVKPETKWEKPEFHYSFPSPETFTLGTFLKWFKAADHCYRVALRYEAQQNNTDVNRDINCLVLKKYIHPKCAELLRYLKKVPEDRIM